ncbi:hypothetical protein NDU88_009277 [Pleurodeles waltl]|uniref:Uncharacterized protein n=1 Tax=Pleurodeles waltl TaxID=8319 RepID=A0AAV7P1V3_PLEWA|nr:hypothetical protein NDU88_009277 [Pleurodeles waltl]
MDSYKVSDEVEGSNSEEMKLLITEEDDAEVSEEERTARRRSWVKYDERSLKELTLSSSVAQGLGVLASMESYKVSDEVEGSNSEEMKLLITEEDDAEVSEEERTARRRSWVKYVSSHRFLLIE